jgi:hypothetical protein
VTLPIYATLPSREIRLTNTVKMEKRQVSERNHDNQFLLNTYMYIAGPTQSPIDGVPGVLSPGVKRHGIEADHSPSTSAEVKKM